MSTLNIDQLLRKGQHWTGVAFSAFLSLHLFNTMTGAISQHLYDAVQEQLRKIYRPTWLMVRSAEYVCILGPLAIHIMCSIGRMIIRSRQSTQPKYEHNYTWFNYLKSKLEAPKLHRYSGLILLAIIPIHTFATRFTFHVDCDFSVVTHSMERKPGFAIMFPYYSLMILAGVYHMMYGLNAALLKYSWSRRRVFTMFGIVASVVFVGFMGMSGMLYPDRIDRSKYAIWKNYY